MAAEAAEVSSEFEKSFSAIFDSRILQKHTVMHTHIVQLEAGKTQMVEQVPRVKDDKNSVFLKVFQKTNGDQHSALLNLLHTSKNGPFFDDLRTQQQLGYAVFALSRNYNGVRNFIFSIQS